MKQNKIGNFFRNGMNLVDQNKPAILTGCALVGLITAQITMYKAALEADKILEDRRRKLDDSDLPEEAVKEINKQTVKDLAKVFAAPVISTAATGACILGSHSASNKKLALVTTAYNLSESTVRNLNQKMNDVLGEKNTKAVKSAIKKDKLKEDPINRENILIKKVGDMPAKDVGFSKQEFVSSPAKLESVILDLSDRVRSEMFIPLNDFLEEVGCEPVKYGQQLGWNVEDTVYGRLPIDVSATIDDKKEVFLVVDYDVFARRDLVGG